ncbi:MAG TPA: hypothetical protein PKI03_05765 [Pseudomonadota bacterium]|nr:hypothetical protein [Pseudomonadota bacterium]
MRASLSRLFRGLRVGFSVGLLGLWAVSGCATGPDPILTTGGKVPPTIENSLRCPSGTHIVFGRIAGVQTAAWCERSAVPAGAGPGVKHGPYVEWYETLQKKVTGLHEEGLRQGPWRFYMPSGVLDSEIVYDRGNVVSQTSAPTPSYVPPSSAPMPAPAAPATAPAVAPSAAPSATPTAPAAAPPAPLPAPVSPTAR